MLKGKLEELGLQGYLDATKKLHNNLGYADFVKLFEGDAHKDLIAKKFGVVRSTVYNWIEVYTRLEVE